MVLPVSQALGPPSAQRRGGTIYTALRASYPRRMGAASDIGDADDTCQSCGARRTCEYCPTCGERRFDRHDWSLSHVVEHGIEGFTHFDYKVPRTLWTLLTRPGAVEADILAGRRTVRAKPFALFVIVNLVFYFGASLIGFTGFSTPARIHATLTPYKEFAAELFASQAAAKGVPLDSYMASFDALVPTVAKTMPFLFAVVMPIWMAALLWWKRRFLLEHFHVALLWTTRMLLIVLLLNTFFRFTGRVLLAPLPMSYDASSSLVLAFVLGWTWFGTLRRTYDLKPAVAVPVSVLATLGFFATLLLVYRPVLMLLTVSLL